MHAAGKSLQQSSSLPPRGMDASGGVGSEMMAEDEIAFIFPSSYTLWIFISAGRDACEPRFIWPLTDYLFVNIPRHFAPIQSPGEV